MDAYICQGHLRQVDLIRQMPIAHAVLVPLAAASPSRAAAVRDRQVAHVPVVVHLEVDADPPVEMGPGAVDVQVCDATLDDLGQDLAGPLVRGDTHLGLMSRVQIVLDDGGQLGHRDLVERVTLLLVSVRQGDAV